jgi:hypothetical protein
MRVFFAFCVSICAHICVIFIIYLLAGVVSRPISSESRQLSFLDVAIAQPEAGGLYTRTVWSDRSPGQAKGLGVKKGAETDKYVPQSQLLPNFYLSRGQLTRQPHVLQNVDLSILDSYFRGDRLPFQVDIYLNEYGLVDRVEVVSGRVPDEALMMVKAMLSQIIFTPGAIEDKNVKTIISLEILFPEK